jgi:hypothetical protein
MASRSKPWRMIHPLRTGSQGFACLCSEDAPVYRIFRTIQAQALERGAKGGCFRRGSSGSKRTTSTDAPDRQAEEGTLNFPGHDPTMRRGKGDDHGQQGDDWTGKRCAICPGRVERVEDERGMTRWREATDASDPDRRELEE